MTIQKMIDNLKIMQAEIEWEYPLDYAATIDNVIEILEKSEQGWKTGHWIPSERENIAYGLIMQCSECGTEVLINDAMEHNYCSNCGSRMELE